MVYRVGSGGSSSHGGGGSDGLEGLWEKLVNGSELSEEQQQKLRKALMDKGYSQKDADSIIKNRGKSPDGETPQDIG